MNIDQLRAYKKLRDNHMIPAFEDLNKVLKGDMRLLVTTQAILEMIDELPCETSIAIAEYVKSHMIMQWEVLKFFHSNGIDPNSITEETLNSLP